MPRLSDPQREAAAALFPSALRLCRRFGNRLRLEEHQIDGAASLAAIDAAIGPHPLYRRAVQRTRGARAAECSRSWRGDPPPIPTENLDYIPAPEISEDDEGLIAAACSLPPKQWSAVDLAVIGGLGPSRAARSLGVSKQAVQINLRIALRKLRIQLETSPCP